MRTIATTTRQTPLHAWHQRHGARFAARDGWHLAEYAAAGNGTTLADISHCSKVEVLGNVAPLARALAGSMLDRPRQMVRLDAGLACRLADDRLLLLGETAEAGWTERLLHQAQEQGALAWDATSAWAGFQLRGPHADDLLRRLTALDLRPQAFPPGTCAETGLAGVPTLLVRVSERAETRLYVGWDVAEFVWERLLEAGADLELQVGAPV